MFMKARDSVPLGKPPKCIHMTSYISYYHRKNSETLTSFSARFSTPVRIHDGGSAFDGKLSSAAAASSVTPADTRRCCAIVTPSATDAHAEMERKIASRHRHSSSLEAAWMNKCCFSPSAGDATMRKQNGLLNNFRATSSTDEEAWSRSCECRGQKNI
jgi:hypothetical protein